MIDNRQIAAAIELRVKKSRLRNLSDSALFNECMPDLQAVSKRATDEEFDVVLERIPHFLQ